MADAPRPRRLRSGRDAFKERLVRGDTYGQLLGLLMVTYVMIALLERSPWERLFMSIMLGAVVLLALHTSHVRERAFRLGAVIVAIVVLSTLVQAIRRA